MKQLAWIYLCLLGLAAAFLSVSLAVVLFGPRPGLVAKKLKFGAMIISFNTLLAGCYSSKDAQIAPNCYGAPLTDGGETGTDTDRGTDTHTDTAAIPDDSEIMCYEQTLDSETGSDTTSPGSDSDTVPPCYLYDDTEIECYDAPEEYPTDSDTAESDAGTSDSDADTAGETENPCYLYDDTEVECYDIVDEDPPDAIAGSAADKFDAEGGTGR